MLRSTNLFFYIYLCVNLCVMKRILFFAVVLTMMLITACEPEDVSVSGVSLDVSELVLKTGRDTVLTATVTPKNATDKSVIWYSDNVKVATVNDGSVKALEEGAARIYVETVDGAFTASCLVKVIPSYIAVGSVSLDKDSIELLIGQTDTLTATVLPQTATNKSITWESSNTNVVTVQNGIITATGLGDALVTVTTADGGLTAQCAVSVVEPYVAVMYMQAERLPDMINARADHIIFASGDQLVVAGGHVSEFSTTTSAEYLENGEWHSISMNHTHDMAFSVALRDGRLMLGGGCDSNYGVGQSSYVEIYDPQTHSFGNAPSMNNSRTLCHAVEVADGDVLVSGNWYSYDSNELYSSASGEFISQGSVSESRSTPYVLRSSADNAIVFGPTDNYGSANTIVVDRLKGDAYNVELFNTWRPYGVPVNWRSTDCAIADFSYLIMAKNDNDNPGIIKIERETFSLLETELPIPVTCADDELIYSGLVFTDKEHSVAYLPAYNGRTNGPVYYILKVDYSVTPAKLLLYKTDALDAYASIWSMTKLPDGRLVACGGIYNSNFTPYSTVLAFSPY